MQRVRSIFLIMIVLIFVSSFWTMISCDEKDDEGEDDSESSDDDDDESDTGIKVSGNAFGFPNYEYVVGATVTILEMPGKSATTDDEGYWEFTDLPAGEEATFVLDDPEENYIPINTKTFTLPETDMEQVTFQAPDQLTYAVLVEYLRIVIDDTACQMVSTVTVFGKSIYDEGAHGEEGATVTIDPTVTEDHGPIYFDSLVLPDPTLTETSDDGGVLFINVPEGVYTLSAQKTGVEFISPKMKCMAGYLVNASPPYGIQALE